MCANVLKVSNVRAVSPFILVLKILSYRPFLFSWCTFVGSHADDASANIHTRIIRLGIHAFLTISANPLRMSHVTFHSTFLPMFKLFIQLN